MRTNDSQKTWTDRLNEALALRGKSPADISKATGITPAGIKNGSMAMSQSRNSMTFLLFVHSWTSPRNGS